MGVVSRRYSDWERLVSGSRVELATGSMLSSGELTLFRAHIFREGLIAKIVMEGPRVVSVVDSAAEAIGVVINGRVQVNKDWRAQTCPSKRVSRRNPETPS